MGAKLKPLEIVSTIVHLNRGSLYTYHLIEALQGAANQPSDHTVMLSNLINHLAKTVPESARNLCHKEQTPFFDTAMEDCTCAIVTWIFRPNWLSGCGAKQR